MTSLFLLLVSLATPAAGGSAGGSAGGPDGGPDGKAPRDPENLLREAYFLEVTLGDAAAAAALYRETLSQPALPPRLAALAHLRLGICLQVQEDWAGAERELRMVVDRYPGESDAVATARRHLGSSPRDPARFMPPEVIFYAELVEPARQVSFLSDLIRGTPLENPVDSHLVAPPSSPSATAPSAEPRPPAPPSSTPPAGDGIEQLRAFLNITALRELGKIEGIAFGMTAAGDGPPGLLFVLLPGPSEITRALVKAALAAAMGGAAPESVEGMRVFSLKRQPLHAAVDERQDVVLLGDRRDVVVDAIRRAAHPASSSPAGSGDDPALPALSEVEDFRRAQSARAGSMIFLYADRETALAALLSQVPEENRAAFGNARRLLGLDHLHAVAATVARSGEELRLTLRAGIDAGKHPLWPTVQTPPLLENGLATVPAESLGFFATSVSGGERRWKNLVALLGPIARDLPEKSGGKELRGLFDFLTLGVGMDFGRDFLEEMRSLVVHVPDPPGFPPHLSFCIEAEFNDGDAAAVKMESILAALARTFFGPEAPVRIQDEEPRAGMKLRFIEPVPGLRLLYARAGGTIVVSPLAEVVRRAIETRAARGAPARATIPAFASKALFLRPQAIRRLLGDEKGRSFFDLLAGHLPHVIFFSEETPDGIALELRVPGATQAIQATLRELPRAK